MPDNWAYFELGEDRAVDVFLICPTVDTQSETNALDLNDKLKGNFIYALDLEKGIFEETGRLFSPYYRQMSINAYMLPETERETAKEIAYSDVSAAFRWRTFPPPFAGIWTTKTTGAGSFWPASPKAARCAWSC